MIRSGQLAEAEPLLRKLAEAGDHAAAANLGGLLAEQDRIEEAERWLRPAAEAGRTAAANNLAVLLLFQGRNDEALLLLQAAADACDEAALSNLNGLLASQGETPEAIAGWREAAESGDGDAALELAVRTDDFDEARRWYEAAVAAGNAVAVGDLGAFLLEHGHLDEAEPWLRKAAVNAPGHAFNLGQLMMQRGDKAERSGGTGKPPRPALTTVRSTLVPCWKSGVSSTRPSVGIGRLRTMATASGC